MVLILALTGQHRDDSPAWHLADRAAGDNALRAHVVLANREDPAANASILVVVPDGQRRVLRTVKLLFALARGTPVVSYRWLKDSVRAQRPLEITDCRYDVSLEVGGTCVSCRDVGVRARGGLGRRNLAGLRVHIGRARSTRVWPPASLAALLDSAGAEATVDSGDGWVVTTAGQVTGFTEQELLDAISMGQRPCLPQEEDGVEDEREDGSEDESEEEREDESDSSLDPPKRPVADAVEAAAAVEGAAKAMAAQSPAQPLIEGLEGDRAALQWVHVANTPAGELHRHLDSCRRNGRCGCGNWNSGRRCERRSRKLGGVGERSCGIAMPGP